VLNRVITFIRAYSAEHRWTPAPVDA
jgi:hypothetical protein